MKILIRCIFDQHNSKISQLFDVWQSITDIAYTNAIFLLLNTYLLSTFQLCCISCHFLPQHKCRCSCRETLLRGNYHLERITRGFSNLINFRDLNECKFFGKHPYVFPASRKKAAGRSISNLEKSASRTAVHSHPCEPWRDPSIQYRAPATCTES